MENKYKDIDLLLDDLVNHLALYFDYYKRYFIVKLGNLEEGDYELIFVYDKTFNYKPIESEVHKKYRGTKFVSINQFNLRKPKDKSKTNYLCIFLFLSKLNIDGEAPKLLHSIDLITNKFKYFQAYSVYKKKIVKGKENDRKKFRKDVMSTLSTFLSNTRIHFEEEKIIKRLCNEKFSETKVPIVFYKTLKEGFSGAKVVEIIPKRDISLNRQKRYIIKYALLNHEMDLNAQLLYKEYLNYKNYIEGGQGAVSAPQYAQTDTHEGIIIDYAISPDSQISYAFSEILESEDSSAIIIDSKKAQFYNQSVKIIDQLFKDNGMMKDWNYMEKITALVPYKDLYQDYLRTENRILESIKIIEGIEDSELANHSLSLNYEKIKNYSERGGIYKKTCHGDLHSENFFKDENAVHLIDFGYTEKRHCVIDYTSLECSIKFKHFPFYLSNEDYLLVEEYLSDSATFSDRPPKSPFKRQRINKLLDIILNIRRNCFADIMANKNANQKQYEISLFLMSIRQVQYKDLNQRYALKAADYLGKKLVEQLKIK